MDIVVGITTTFNAFISRWFSRICRWMRRQRRRRRRFGIAVVAGNKFRECWFDVCVSLLEQTWSSPSSSDQANYVWTVCECVVRMCVCVKIIRRWLLLLLSLLLLLLADCAAVNLKVRDCDTETGNHPSRNGSRRSTSTRWACWVYSSPNSIYLQIIACVKPRVLYRGLLCNIWNCVFFYSENKCDPLSCTNIYLRFLWLLFYQNKNIIIWGKAFPT